jgi:eukaryotic-like serine/threonine-protein kinase
VSTQPPDPYDPVDPGAEDETIVDETRVITPEGDQVVERQETRRRRRFDPIWPWLLALLVLVLVGIGLAWYLTRENTKPVPDVTGATEAQALSRLQEEGFEVAVERGNSPAPRGTVFDQDPGAGAEAEEGSTVTVSVSEGPATAAVPDVVGTNEDSARGALESAGFKVNAVQVFSPQEKGSVVAQNPRGGADAQVGSTVRINVSKGTGTTTVPSVVGLGEDDAKQQLSDADLQANVVEVPSPQDAGTVVAQSPPAGSELKQGSTVRLNVSRGLPEPPPATTETTPTTTETTTETTTTTG